MTIEENATVEFKHRRFLMDSALKYYKQRYKDKADLEKWCDVLFDEFESYQHCIFMAVC